MSWELIIGISGVVISIISICIAGWSAYNSKKYSGQQTELQRRIVELEEQREEEKKRFQESAGIEAKIDFEETGGHRFPRKILIWNHGPADAKNLKVLVDGHPPSQVEHLITKKRNDTIEVLPAGDYYDYSFGNREENQASIEIIVMYDDPLAEENEYKTKLRL